VDHCEVSSVERLVDRGTRRGLMLIRRFGEDVRRRRLEAGLSQRQLGAASGLSHAAIGRMERGEVSVDVLAAARTCSVLGMELGISTHLIGSPARDRAHVALLERFRSRLAPSLTWRTEVPLPIIGDARAIDGVVAGREFRAMVEAETRLGDVEATERKMQLKQRDSGIGRKILLLNETRHNRAVVDATPELRESFPMRTREVLGALGRGHDPGGDGIVFL
jgi:transcriptional regulator with XRE-family HTH domain